MNKYDANTAFLKKCLEKERKKSDVIPETYTMHVTGLNNVNKIETFEVEVPIKKEENE